MTSAATSQSSGGPDGDGLEVTLETTVTREQIDHLGHMNVMFYAAHARAGTGAMLERIGLGKRVGKAEPVVTDPLTTHRREQLAGAPLVLRSALLDAHPERIRLYHELENPQREEIAATYVHGVELIDTDPWESHAFPEDVVVEARRRAVPLPSRGVPRTLPVDQPPETLTLEEALARGLELTHPRVIGESEVGDRGRVSVNESMRLIWSGEPVDPNRPLFSWATMESRHRSIRPPRAGDRIQSFGAEVMIGEKVFRTRSWIFDLDDGALVAVSDMVGLTFDTDTRQATPIPADLRVRLEARFHPDLA